MAGGFIGIINKGIIMHKILIVVLSITFLLNSAIDTTFSFPQSVSMNDTETIIITRNTYDTEDKVTYKIHTNNKHKKTKKVHKVKQSITVDSTLSADTTNY